MIRNYFKIAIRNLRKNKLFSIINILGLGLGIPFALLSLMHLQSTFEFDNFHADTERIYRIVTDETSNNGVVVSYASTPFLLADNLKNDYPTIEKTTKVVRQFGWELNNPLKTLKVNTIVVEPSFFEIFNFKLDEGKYPIEPNTLVLTCEMAEKFFGETNPIGQTLTHPTFGVFTITGILKPFKTQTQFKSDIMVSMATYLNINTEANQIKSWANYDDTFTFVKLRSNANPVSLDLALKQIAQKTSSFIAFAKKKHDFRKQELAAISPSREELRNNPYVDKWSDIYFNFSIPFMILLLAGFNYTNLTLARSLSRSKEVGVRKVMGAQRFQLVLQFICEAVVIAFFSLLVGVLMLSLMKQFIHVKWLVWEVDNQFVIWVLFVLFTLMLGVIAGSLPAWVLSSFQPVKVLKGSLSPAAFGRINVRKSLVVIQFVVTLCFVFQIGHMYNQFRYMATENDNFNRKNIFNLSLADKNYGLLIDEILKNKDVDKIGLTSVPFGSLAAELAIKAQKKDENNAAYYYAANNNFIENMQLKFLAGQNLPESKADSATNFVVINEKAVEKLQLGTPQEAIGKSIWLNNQFEAQIIGVVQNFCHFNYQFQIEPVVFQYNPAHFQVLVVTTNPNVSQENFTAEMQTIWKKQFPYKQMGYTWFENELYDRYYPAEDMKMMGVASFVILVIAVMGLLGMVIYTTEKRTKEIGIRKVMGASIWHIVRILSWSFVKLLLIAGIISIPLGYMAGEFFNSFFVFHADLNIKLMGLFFVLIFIIAIVTIGHNTIRAALMNPVKSLKTE